MSETTFFEIIIPIDSDYSIIDRHDIEDRLDEILKNAGLGEVTGGGAGAGYANIDIEVNEPHRGLTLIRETLRFLAVPSGTVIEQSGSSHNVYD